MKLTDFGYSRYSQYGEDGIIEKIFDCIGTASRVCVEVGAWDGYHLSNTANLWTRSWRGVLIECDDEKFERLRKNTASYDCICIKELVGRGEHSLESILRRHGVGDTFDLLSIDVDGEDYYIFESLRQLRPRVVIVEYNPTIPAQVDLYAAPNNYFGCSVAALARLGCERGYRLAALTDTNAFFVVEEEFPKLAAFETALHEIRIDKHLMYLVTSFAGDYVLCGTPLFRLNLPYRGELHGPHQKVVFKGRYLRLFRLPHKLLRELRSLSHRVRQAVRGDSAT
jgi:hypothetical protein